MEYCKYGNLHNYLLRHREDFINQIDPVTKRIDYNIGYEELERTFTISSDGSNRSGRGVSMADYRGNSGYNGRTINTENTEVCMTPSPDSKGLHNHDKHYLFLTNYFLIQLKKEWYLVTTAANQNGVQTIAEITAVK